MNLFALSTVVQANAVDVENMLRKFEGRRRKYPTVDHTSRFGITKTFELVPHKDNEPQAEFDVDTISAIERVEMEKEKERTAEICDDNGELMSRLGADEALIVPRKEGAGEESGIEHKAENDLGSVGSPHSHLSVTTPMVEIGGKLESMYTEQKLDPEPGWDLPESYTVTSDQLRNLCRECHMADMDIDIVDAMFRLVDSRGFDEADLRSVVVPLAICTCKESVRECFALVFSCFDRAQEESMEKMQMLKIFNLMNEGIIYVGDRPLDSSYVMDLVDSVYTTAGKIDGHINYAEYIELISEHPIVEMFLTPQYQGLARDKVFDEETLRGVDVEVDIDYSQKTFGNGGANA